MRAIIVALRASDDPGSARDLPEAHAGRRFVVWGHSQGGHATIYAGLLARGYAPELRLIGVAAAAPATELGVLFKPAPTTPDDQLLTAMLMWSWSRVFDAPFGRLVAPSDMPAVRTLARACFDPPLDGNAQPTEKPMPAVTYKMIRALAATEPWRSLAARNTPAALPPDVPVFLAQGSDDATIPPAVTADYMRRLCRAGDRVRMLVMEGVDHRLTARDAASAAIDWIGDRFAGKPAPNDCRDGGRR